MKLICTKCCDNINIEPCKLTVPNDTALSKKDILEGLTTCPFEGMNYIQGKWVTNGINFKAEWRVKGR